MTGLAICPLCNEPIELEDRHWQYQRVQGWERMAGVRASGKHGGSDITLREQLDVFAHGHCIARLKNGIPIGQQSLV